MQMKSLETLSYALFVDFAHEVVQLRLLAKCGAGWTVHILGHYTFRLGLNK